MAGGRSGWSAGGISAAGGGVVSARLLPAACQLAGAAASGSRSWGASGVFVGLGASARGKRGLTERAGEGQGRCRFSGSSATETLVPLLPVEATRFEAYVVGRTWRLLRRAACPRQLVSADQGGRARGARQARHARGSRPRPRRRRGRRPRAPGRSGAPSLRARRWGHMNGGRIACSKVTQGWCGGRTSRRQELI